MFVENYFSGTFYTCGEEEKYIQGVFVVKSERKEPLGTHA
jgi:hypothetical protein